MTKIEINQKIQKITQKIVKEYQPDKIILFGSYAWGKPGPDSDVDLFIIKDTDNTRQTARQIDGALFPRTIPLDIIVYRPQTVKENMDDFFIKDVVTKGKVLYEKKS